MKYSNTNNSAHPRKQQTTISSTVVRCVCITACCVVTSCGLLGFGVTCFLIKLTDPSAAPCPFLDTIIVFGVAVLLFLFSFVSLLVLCVRRNSGRKAQLEDLPVTCVVEEQKKSGEENCTEGEVKKKDSVSPEEPHCSEQNFKMTQVRGCSNYYYGIIPHF